MNKVFHNDRLITTVLSWVAGYVDTASFLNLNGLFTAHLTGNLVVTGAEIAGLGGKDAWVRLAVIPIFIAAVILTTAISQNYCLQRSVALWFQSFTLLVFAIVSINLVPIGRDLPVDDMAIFISGATGIFSMGVQNTLMREVFSGLALTTMMTGNLTQLTIDIARLISIKNCQKTDRCDLHTQEIKQRISKISNALISFFIGATCGAFITSKLGFWSMLIPTGGVVFLAMKMQENEASRLL